MHFHSAVAFRGVIMSGDAAGCFQLSCELVYRVSVHYVFLRFHVALLRPFSVGRVADLHKSLFDAQNYFRSISC